MEYGKDFLREMDSPLCLSKPIQLPVNLRSIHPGRCLELSAFGHSSVMGFQCESCALQCSDHAVAGQGFLCAPTHPAVGNSRPMENNDLYSITLAFYNNADKVVQHKIFYLSLLSHSNAFLRKSFQQPSLLYTYILFKTLCTPNIVPIFKQYDLGIGMFFVFKDKQNLHLKENVIRLASDNLNYYSITLDCIYGTYVLSVIPEYSELQKIKIPEEEICEAVSSLDYSDEIKEELLKGAEIVSTLINADNN